VERIVLEGPRSLRLDCRVPDRRRERVRGLAGIDALDPSEAMLFRNVTSVHTFGMRFPLLIARLDRSLTVVAVHRLVPRRMLAPTSRAAHVLECSTGVDLRPGDHLRVTSAGSPSGSAPDLRGADGYTASAVPGGRAPIV
jgi:uncharacterized protein